MYRLLKASSLPLHTACRNPAVQYLPRTCFFCNFCHQRSTSFKSSNRLQLRHHSSIINNVMLSSVGKRKVKRRSKKYAELLEVTDSTTINQKAAVQNLNAAQLSILVDQPDITLDKLHKINGKKSVKKQRFESRSAYATASPGNSVPDQVPNHSANFSKFRNNFKPSLQREDESEKFLETMDEKGEGESLVEDLQSSGIVDETMLIKSSSFANSIRNSDEDNIGNDAMRSEKSWESIDLEESEKKIIVTERKAKEASIHEEKQKQFNKIFLGYMDVCVNSKSLNCGKKIFDLFKKRKRKKDHLHVNDILVFNTQIQKLAFNADLKSILEILEHLRETGIKLSAQTYAYMFDCIGRMKSTDEAKLEIIRQIQEEMNKDKISLNDVMTKSYFICDQRKFVKNTVKLIDDQFKPIYEVPDTGYDCRLLKNFKEEEATPSSTINGLLSIKDFENRMIKQIDMEISGQVTVHNISKQNISCSNVTNWRTKLENIEKTWEKAALRAFKRNLETLKSRELLQKANKMMLHPYLSVLKPEDYVRVLMREVRNLGMGSEIYSLPFLSLCSHTGILVYKMYEVNIKQNNGVNDKMKEVYLQYCDWFINRNDKMNSRVKWTLLEHEANKQGITLGVDVPSWQNNIHVNIGKFLFNIILNDLKLDATYIKKKKSHHGHHASAFYKIFRHSGVMLKEEVKPHPYVAKLYRDSQLETLTFDTTLVPSLCPPRPWVSVHNGGYIITKTDIVRVTHMGNQQWDRLVSAPPKKLYPSLDSLNQLASVPWTVNSSVLDVAIKVFRNNGSVELNMPQPPSVLPSIAAAPKDATPEEKRKVDKEQMELKRKKNEMYSLWCDALYRLSLANHFRGEIFWLPHNMDFRGRVYPVPPHLNHLGSDLARSMLVFALKKPLGPKGLDWLKLHTINLTGFKKRDPISERLKYADQVMDKIIDSAENPLTGEMWWASSDEPWQTLSACMEIAAALKSENPEEFMSGFPIHQDGSCNGLQHYAALGRDQIGAESVNLYPSYSPQDVYSSVATMVDQRRKEDAEKGHEIAKILDGFIKRKVIKQTVMTTVYGVTWFGAKLQIARQLKDINDFPQEHLWPASTYLVQKTFQTLRTMFKSAREIQDWFTECSRLICIARQQNMEWVTPLGLPVVQPYSKVVHSTQNKNSVSALFSPDIYRKPNVMKQKNAFAPNYVHSLDSSHMMLTSVHCEHVGITFVSVHDCYWTHPCTVEIMNKICREQFVALHSEPILKDLSNFLIEKFAFHDVNMEENVEVKGNKYPIRKKLNTTLKKVPEQGDFDLNGVLKSTYFFS